MGESDSRLKDLLDGKLSAEEIAEDPVLASLAERIYGADFLDQVGISRGATKRALAEQFTEIEGDDLLIDTIPDTLPDLPMPADMPPVPMVDVEPDTPEGRSLLSKLRLGFGATGISLALVNLFYGFGNLLGTCADEVHQSCAANMKLNWLEFHRMGEHIAWSPTGTLGIPDIGLIVLSLVLIVQGIRNG